MKIFLIKLFIFLSTIFILLFVFNLKGKDLAGKIFPSPEHQFEVQYKNAILNDYNTLILGNSRIQNGINPDLLSLKSFNFAFMSDSYDVIYSKIKYIVKEKGLKFRYIILGTDYFQFSYTSESKNPFKDYLSDNEIYSENKQEVKKEIFTKELDKKFNVNMIQNFTGPFNIILKSLKGIIGKDITIAVQKENGQLAVKEAPLGNQPIFRDPTKLDSEVWYFEKILEYSKNNNIIIFLIIPPTTKEELQNYNDKEKINFDNFIGNYMNKYQNLKFLDYSVSNDFQLNDYIDMTHLNNDGADKFTKILDKDFMGKIN